jgi:starch synthase (maltosyl-transferring)
MHRKEEPREESDLDLERAILQWVGPEVACGRFPIRRVAGEGVEVEAEALAFDGAVVRCALRYRPEAEEAWRELPMTPAAPGRWRGRFEVPSAGLWLYDVAAWIDDFATWRQGLAEAPAEGIEGFDLAAGARLLRRAAAAAQEQARPGDAKVLAGLARALDADEDARDRLRLALDPELAPLLERYAERRFASVLPAPRAVLVEPAGTPASWCSPMAFAAATEVLPASRAEPAPEVSESFDAELKLLAGLGFDAVVLPCSDLFAIRPEAVEAARRHGFAVALDLPLRLPLAHRRVAERPDWFRRSGASCTTGASALLDLAGDGWQELWPSVLTALAAWVEEGVEIFWCGEPELAPPGFWAWLLPELRRRHPQVRLWARAAPRREVSLHLWRLGFSLFAGIAGVAGHGAGAAQVAQIESRLAPLSPSPEAAPAPAFAVAVEGAEGGERELAIQLALAATLGGPFGALGLAAGSPAVARLAARLNQLRRERPALFAAGAFRFHPTGQPQLVCFSRSHGAEVVVVVASLTGDEPAAAWIELDLAPLGLHEEQIFQVEDRVSGVRYLWQGRRNFVRVVPAETPVQVLRIVR